MYESGALVTRPLAVFADGDLAGVDFGTGFGDLAGPFGLAAAVPGDFVRAGLFAGGRPFGFAATFGFAFSIFSTASAAASLIAATISLLGSSSSASEPGVSSRASSASSSSATGSSMCVLFFFFFDFLECFDFDRRDFLDLLRANPGLEDDEELVESDEEADDDDDDSDEDDEVSLESEEELDQLRCFFFFFEWRSLSLRDLFDLCFRLLSFFCVLRSVDAWRLTIFFVSFFCFSLGITPACTSESIWPAAIAGNRSLWIRFDMSVVAFSFL